MPVKTIYIDLETTGLSHYKCAITEIGMIVEVPGFDTKGYRIQMKPFEDAKIEKGALKVQGKTLEEITDPNLTDQATGFQQLLVVLENYIDPYVPSDKFHVVGYNIGGFDIQFLRSFFVRNGSRYMNSYFHHPTLDVMFLAAEYLKDKRHVMENFKLATVAKVFNIHFDPANLHNAMEDIRITKEIYKRITEDAPRSN